jgi:antitoxin component of RelBE/YafQ-DinJ toxin-antitoxin module
MKKKMIAFQIPEDMYEQLKKEGRQMGLTFSAYVRYLLMNRHK